MRETTSKRKLLKAARLLFSEKGFNGVSTHDIATTAGINHSLIFHYFKNKEGLWVAVKEDIEREYLHKHSLKLSTSESFDQFLKKLIHHYIVFYETNPEIQKLFAWQRLEFSTLAKREHPLSLTDDFAALCNCFREYQRRGEIDETLDPRYITLYIFSCMETTVQTLSTFIPPSEKNSYLSFFKNRLKRGLR
jgi:AcrR family transcriptional regulator